MKAKPLAVFNTYVQLFLAVLQLEHDTTLLARDFSGHHIRYVYAVEILEPLVSCKTHVWDWLVLCTVLDLLAFPVSSANAERISSMFHSINWKNRASMTNSNIGKYSCIHYNKFQRQYGWLNKNIFVAIGNTHWNLVCQQQRRNTWPRGRRKQFLVGYALTLC